MFVYVTGVKRKGQGRRRLTAMSLSAVLFSHRADPKIYREVGNRVQAFSLTSEEQVVFIPVTFFVLFSHGLYLQPGTVCKLQAL